MYVKIKRLSDYALNLLLKSPYKDGESTK